MFRKRKKKEKKEDFSNMSFYDLLTVSKNKIDEKLRKLENLRERGEISDEEYLKIREALEKIKRQLEDLRHFPQEIKNQNG